ncbi:MAG: HIT domain-containing protein [bacterium]|nr:HIT domain-containing protein [bacterium]
MKCVYCETPEIVARTIVTNKVAFAFPTNIPIVPGHTLVCPKRCVRRYEDLSTEEKEAIEELRVKICGALKTVLGAEGFNFAWNDGESAGQSVSHFHLHILPRREGDTGIYEYEPRKFLYRTGSREPSPEAELQRVSERIAAAL